VTGPIEGVQEELGETIRNPSTFFRIEAGILPIRLPIEDFDLNSPLG